MSVVRDVIDRLKVYEPTAHVAVDIWTEDDVLERAGEVGVKLTRSQAQKVLDIMDRRKDANVGFNWDVLDVHIESVAEEGETGKPDPRRGPRVLKRRSNPRVTPEVRGLRA